MLVDRVLAMPAWGGCQRLAESARVSRSLRRRKHRAMLMDDSYQQFIETKSTACAAVGFDPTAFIAPLFPFQLDIVTMACRVGRFCIWADCGMGKTAMQLVWAYQVHQHTGGNVLVLAPLSGTPPYTPWGAMPAVQ